MKRNVTKERGQHEAREARLLRGALLRADANATIRPPRLDFSDCTLMARDSCAACRRHEAKAKHLHELLTHTLAPVAGICRHVMNTNCACNASCEPSCNFFTCTAYRSQRARLKPCAPALQLQLPGRRGDNRRQCDRQRAMDCGRPAARSDHAPSRVVEAAAARL